ncbi:toprim domain-containing protein [Cryobacterium sp. M91]|uniref:toprim domain-containing protein n=1 Tax=Cryobacterium sp. M91 TaxID=2048294 RepID=UPI001304AF35|nr:toprim domain-containing protein [Cryobacterium sp. M91]
MNCFAGCEQAAIRKALSWSDVWMPGNVRHQMTYPYVGVAGDLIFEVLRGTKNGMKEISQRAPDPESRSGYRWSLKGLTVEQRQTVFMAPAVRMAIDADETIYVVEGEKDVLSAMALGLTATCNAGGAGKFTELHAQQLTGADVAIVQDKDDAGRMQGAQVYRLLAGVAKSVRLFDVHPKLPEKADLTDHLGAGFTLADLVEVDPTPLATSNCGNGGNGGKVASGSSPADPVPSGGSDSEASERLVACALRGAFLWTRAADWLRWNERVWCLCSVETVIEVARRWAKAEVMAAVTAYDPDNQESVSTLKRAQSLLAKNKLGNVVALAKGQLECDFDEFDLDADIFVALNGVVDLRTGTLMKHDPARLVTKSSLVAYRSGATHLDWLAALDAVPDDVAHWLQDRFGQGVTGHVPNDDVMGVLEGGGENGKSTILGAVLKAAGNYAGIIPDKVLLSDKGSQHSTELMTLKQLRLAIIEETPEERFLDVARIKKILGTPGVVARYVNRDNVTFDPTWAIFISTNYPLGVNEVDHGTWRRLAKVVFPYRYRDLSKGDLIEFASDLPGDPGLRDRLKHGAAQQEAVLAWLIEGAGRWYSNNRRLPGQPASVRESTLEWRKEADQWLAYADDHLVLEPGAAIWLEDVQRALNLWQQGRGQRTWGMSTFKARLQANPWMKQESVAFSGQEVRDPATLSRPDQLVMDLKPAPSRPRCLLGVRFRTPEDDVAVLEAVAAGISASHATKKRIPVESGRPMPVITDIDEAEAA